MGDKAKIFSKPDEQAQATVTLIQGLKKCSPWKQPHSRPPEASSTLSSRCKKISSLLRLDNKKVKCSGKDKARKKAAQKLKKGGKKPTEEEIQKLAKEIYIEEAHHKGLSQIEWTENGEPKEGLALKCKRKVRGVRYVTEKDDDGNEIRKRTIVATNPVFHKLHIDGNYYEQEFGDYVPRDTMLHPACV